MRKGFTLIELMIVIAIIAIIAAIAIPNLLESRIVSNEAAAATTLKAGVFPAQVQFQAGAYADDANGIYGIATSAPTGAGGNGIGDFAASFAQLSGGDTKVGSVAPKGTNPPLALLATSWNAIAPTSNNFTYGVSSNNENGFGAACHPNDQLDSIGRRCFAINASGIVYSTVPAVTNPSTLIQAKAGEAEKPFPSMSYGATAATATPVTGAFKTFKTSSWSAYKR